MHQNYKAALALIVLHVSHLHEQWKLKLSVEAEHKIHLEKTSADI